MKQIPVNPVKDIVIVKMLEVSPDKVEERKIMTKIETLIINEYYKEHPFQGVVVASSKTAQMEGILVGKTIFLNRMPRIDKIVYGVAHKGELFIYNNVVYACIRIADIIGVKT